MRKITCRLFNLPVILLLLLFAGFYSTTIIAQTPSNVESKKIIAVLDFKGQNIDQTDAVIITDFFRDKLFETGRFVLIDKGIIDSVIRKFNYEAAGICGVECAINIGENLQADKVINGDVSKLGEKFIISIRMVDIAEATLQMTATFEKKCRLEDLTSEMPGIISQFMEKYSKLLGKSGQIAEPENVQIVDSQQSGKGKIRITVIPNGATVIANDKLLGISPVAEKELEIGVYKITASKLGYEPKEITVNISSGKIEDARIELKALGAQRGAVDNKSISKNKDDEQLLPKPSINGLYLGVQANYLSVSGSDFYGWFTFNSYDASLDIPKIGDMGFGGLIGFREGRLGIEGSFITSSPTDPYFGDATLTIISIYFKFWLGVSSSVQPYLLLGVDSTHLSVTDGTLWWFDTDFTYHCISSNSDYKGLNLDLGAGISFYVTPKIALNAGANIHFLAFSSVSGVLGASYDLDESVTGALINIYGGLTFYL